uniref:uridine kinase family protein n=1 Tax=Paenibacillus sp. FSL H8-0168 TaxID=2921378 RepID=UPI00406CEA9B
MKAVRYQRYDWETDKLSEWHTVPAGGIVIIEGVYSIRKELEDKYDFKVWVDCPRKIRLSRGLERDGDCTRGMDYNRPLINATSLHFLTLYKQQKKPLLRKGF